MTATELIEERKKVIRRQFKGYDSTLKLSGNQSFTSILNDIDNNIHNKKEWKELKEDEVYSRLSSILSMSMIKSKRMNNKRAENLLNSSKTFDEMSYCIREYMALHSPVYTISEKEAEYFNSIVSTESEKLKIALDIMSNSIDMNESEYMFNIVYNNRLYSGDIGTDLNNNSRFILDTSVSFSDKDKPVATYQYTLYINKDDTTKVERNLVNMCSNNKCVFHKTSLYSEYSDGSKEVLCTNEDCKKCDAFKDTLRPDELVTVACAVLYAINLRNSNTRVEIENAPKYEPIPLPESDKDVVIYLDKYYDEIRKTRVKVYDDNYIPGTHASPREHIRKSCIVHRKNGKTFERKGCIVNEGHTKTSYTIKATKRSKENLTKKPEDYVKELLGLKEDI